jgi:hypothetical protein
MRTPLVQIVKSSIAPRRWRALRRATNRMRWLLKLRLLRHYGFPVARRPVRALRYILWDPEVESFTYEVANAQELARAAAPLLGVDAEQVCRWIDEARTDPLLTRDRGFHWSSKRRQPLGNRTLWYAVIRATKPKLVVEAGVHEGLGSEAILVALRRNAREGHPGTLISFDIFEDTGWLVAPELRDNWVFVLESTLSGMQRALRGRKVDLFIHETPHTQDIINHEVGVALRHAGNRGLTVIDSAGYTCDALRRICDSCDVACQYLLDEPLDHIVRSNGTNIAIFDRAAAARARVPAPRAAPPEEHDVETAIVAKLAVATAACADALAAAGEAATVLGA